jgi:hypothetical protein
MNEQVHQKIVDFYNDILMYMMDEYKPKYYKAYNSDKNIDRMIELTSRYYFGGSTIPNATGEIVEYIKVDNDF